MSNQAVLSVENLSVRYGGVLAVDHVNFTLRRNSLHCLIGPNGAGKSTLFKAIAGIARPASGRIWINGHESTRLPAYRAARLGIGIKTQRPNLLEDLSVEENLWIAARFRHDSNRADQVVGSLLDRIGIQSSRLSRVADLAHGHRQLVELASALATEPLVVLLDEPAAGLADSEVNELGKVLMQLASEAALLVVEHNTRFVRSIAETVTVLHKGRILATGPPSQIFADDRVKDIYLGREIAQ